MALQLRHGNAKSDAGLKPQMQRRKSRTATHLPLMSVNLGDVAPLRGACIVMVNASKLSSEWLNMITPLDKMNSLS